MQKKQVKIMGFQAENCKIKLFYETDGLISRYIVEINRKYWHITNDLKEAQSYFQSKIYEKLNQIKLNI